MTNTVIMPQLGETVAEGKILKWFKSVGDDVKEGDNLFEVETDKVTLEVQSIVSGRLERNSRRRGDRGESRRCRRCRRRRRGDASDSRLVAAAKTARPGVATTPPRSPFEEVTTPLDRFGSAKSAEGVRVTPLARRLIAQNGLQLATLAAEAQAPRARKGSRKRTCARRWLRRSRLGAPSPAVAAASPPSAAEGEVVALSAVRLRTAERLAENWRTIPHVFQAIEVDFTALDLVRRQRRDAFRTAQGFSLTFLPFIARATCLAIRAFPADQRALHRQVR